VVWAHSYLSHVRDFSRVYGRVLPYTRAHTHTTLTQTLGINSEHDLTAVVVAVHHARDTRPSNFTTFPVTLRLPFVLFVISAEAEAGTFP